MMMDCYTYHFPTTIRFGPGVVKELAQHLIDEDIHAPLVVTDPTCANLPFFKKIIESLQAENITVTIFDEIHKNPVKSDVEKGVEHFHEGSCDAIIGIGGGASIDVARAIAILANHGGDLFDYEETKGGDQLITDNIPYFITIPTTSGTGSEVGRSTVISDDDTHEKKILFSPYLMAKRVYADPELTLDLPAHITAATGLDALTHHIEALFAKGFHPLCDGIAIEGIKLIWNNIETATLEPTLESRSNMMISALMGAVSFQKGLGVVHSTAHPLSTLFDIHHGLANAIMLVHGVRFNAPHCPETMEILENTIGENDVITAIQDLNQHLKLPTTLEAIGIEEKDIDKLVSLAIRDPCHQCNPHLVTKEDFKQLYRDAL
jgi:alcohol dehydrogenase class IV